MKRDCSTCICKEGSCYPSTTIFDKDKTCKSYDPDYEGYIADLEKENERLTVSYETLKLHDEEEIGMLKSENAELKDYRLTTLAKQQTGMSKYALNLEHKLSWYDDQLTKAKEIIKDLLSLCEGETDSKLVFARAEQFISEVEK